MRSSLVLITLLVFYPATCVEAAKGSPSHQKRASRKVFFDYSHHENGHHFFVGYRVRFTSQGISCLTLCGERNGHISFHPGQAELTGRGKLMLMRYMRALPKTKQAKRPLLRLTFDDILKPTETQRARYALAKARLASVRKWMQRKFRRQAPRFRFVYKAWPSDITATQGHSRLNQLRRAGFLNRAEGLRCPFHMRYKSHRTTKAQIKARIQFFHRALSPSPKKKNRVYIRSYHAALFLLRTYNQGKPKTVHLFPSFEPTHARIVGFFRDLNKQQCRWKSAQRQLLTAAKNPRSGRSADKMVLKRRPTGVLDL